jgi:hypothetical protein
MTSITRKRINNKKVQVVPVDKVDPEMIKGNHIFSELYNNIFICAKKNSGKTNLIWNILRSCINKRTIVHAFVGTHNNDQTYTRIKELLDHRKIENYFYDSILDGKEDILAKVIQQMKDLDKPQEEGEDEDEETKKTREEKLIEMRVKEILKDQTLDGDEEEKEKKPRLPKLLSPQHLIIIDDLPSELKSKSVETLLKTNRHLKCRTIISTQWLNDLRPGSRRQINSYLLFGGFSSEKLEQLFQNADLDMTFETFEALYRDCTAKKYCFMFIDGDRIRRNLDEEYEL